LQIQAKIENKKERKKDGIKIDLKKVLFVSECQQGLNS
jgi:hypothetical protein